jgi:hypothetical protein
MSRGNSFRQSTIRAAFCGAILCGAFAVVGAFCKPSGLKSSTVGAGGAANASSKKVAARVVGAGVNPSVRIFDLENEIARQILSKAAGDRFYVLTSGSVKINVHGVVKVEIDIERPGVSVCGYGSFRKPQCARKERVAVKRGEKKESPKDTQFFAHKKLNSGISGRAV